MHKQAVKLPDGRFVIAKFRNPQPVTELHASTADFRDLGDRATLAMLGVFSIDKPCHRAAQALEAKRVADLEADYMMLDLDRAEEHALIAQLARHVGASVFAECAALDRLVKRAAARRRSTTLFQQEVMQ